MGFSLKSQQLTTLNSSFNVDNCRFRNHKPRISGVRAVSYQKFINFALEETKNRTVLVPSDLQEKYKSVTALDGETELRMASFHAPKIRLLRSLSIENERFQVLDFAVFPKPEFDVPIFCANIFSTVTMNIVVLDLNPLYDVINQREYRDKYYQSLMPLAVKYTELLPWGGKLTSESLKFFSPIVIWTKFNCSQNNHDVLYSAFMDYYKAWLMLIDVAEVETNASAVMSNCEAQHRYLTWRAEKDPGHSVLKRLVGEKFAKELLIDFLFHGIDQLGNKTFLDYFPEYRCENGNVNEKRSIAGKSFDNRPWDRQGDFIGCK